MILTNGVSLNLISLENQEKEIINKDWLLACNKKVK